MGKKLVVAEKPSVGREIARVLGCKTKAEGAWIGEDYVVSWSVGHLLTLKDPGEYAPKWKTWQMQTLPILPQEMKLKPLPKTRAQLAVLKKWMLSPDISRIICATDSGREGELIFRYIYQYVKAKKPVDRLWISSMTDQAIQEGFSHLHPGAEYDLLYASAKARAQADWLVGMNASRAFTLRYHALLSIGRVQTPTLAMLVQRQKEIEDFQAEDYYELTANFGDYKGVWFSESPRHTHLKDQPTAEALAQKVNQATATVVQIEKEEKQKVPPLLYDLTELQRDCNNRFGFSAQKTLDLAQSLYEKRKAITYPRTDSRYLSHDLKEKVRPLLARLKAIPTYEKWASYLLDQPELSMGKRIFDDAKVSDHHAILPTDSHLHPEHMTEDEKKVFHLVCLRFMAVFLPVYAYDVTKVVTSAAGETFFSKGTVVRHLGWKILYRALDAKKEQEIKADPLPPFMMGQERIVQEARVEKKQTKPPKPYTEAGLLSAMEHAGRQVADEDLREQMKDSGLGTPATRAAIIERLIAVGYVRRQKRELVPTDKGRQLISVVPAELTSPETTGKWEKGLASIAKGKMDPARFRGSIERFVYFLVDQAKHAPSEVVFAPEQQRMGRQRKPKGFGTCPLCQKESVLENSKSFYCGGWKSGCRFTIWKNALEQNGAKVDSHMVKKLLKDGQVEHVPLYLRQTGEKGEGTVRLAKDHSGRLEIMNFHRITQEG
ncbi:MAG TPA: DNA topoisomerase III [Firmicutes bacterium]|nr:DNA topoisomerase III [Bacillota bacterium]